MSWPAGVYLRTGDSGEHLRGRVLETALHLGEVLRGHPRSLGHVHQGAKGVNGADLVQRVRSPSGLVCGTILWEAKQTKAWQPAWLRKLKEVA